MGFLLGAYGKILAGKRMRELQYKQTLIQRKLNRATKDVADMEKRLSRFEKQVQANMQNQMRNILSPFMTAIGNPLDRTGEIDGSQQDAWRAYTMNQMYMQQRMAMAQVLWADQFEMIRDAQLQPLKDYEDEVSTELESVKSQVKLAEQEYKAKEEEEKSGLQYIKPDYTGQG